MKNLMRIFVAMVALFAVSCVTDTTEDVGVGLTNGGAQTTIAISLEESRTQLGEKAGDLYPLYWSEGDQISINGVASTELSANEAGSAVATFSVTGELKAPYCIAYPAANAGEVVFAAQQSYVEGTFSNGASTMYGYSENGEGISMNNLTGVLKVGVVGEHKLVLAQVSTADRAPIAGQFTLDFTIGELAATAASKEVIEYSFGEGVQLSSEATYLHLAVPAGVYDELYVTLYDADGGVMYATVKAGDSKPLSVGKVREFSNNIVYAPNANVYVIRDKESLKGFAAAVNEADSAYTTDALLVADVDMTGEDWTSINWKSASGADGGAQLATFHGNGYAIKGLNAPLFDTLTANVKGLHLRDVNINETARPNVGSLARWLRASKVGEAIAKPLISHCSTTGKITIDCKEFTYDANRELAAYGPFSAGGLIATCLTADIEDCVNEIDMDIKRVVASSNTTTLYPWIGGIVGYIEAIDRTGDSYTAELCSNLRRLENKGDINYHDPQTTFTTSTYSKLSASVGGILGANATKSTACEMHDLVNRGNISMSGKTGNNTYLGGIAGRPETADARNWYNYGKMSFTEGGARLIYLGGVFGYSAAALENNYTNIHNYGEVEVKNITFYSICIGGTIGSALSNSAYEKTNRISNISNNAPVTVSDVTQQTGHTANAYFRVGGVSAWIQHNLEDAVNNKEGVVTIKNASLYNNESGLNGFCVGGVVGYKTVFYTDRCTNHAEINVNATTSTVDATMAKADKVRMNVGGCFGWKNDTTGDECVNNGNINVSGSYVGRLVVGGVVGVGNTSYSATTWRSNIWTNLTNNGDVTIKDGTLAQHVASIGGIMGWTQAGVENATNNGNIYIGTGYKVCNENHFSTMFAYVAKTTTNFKNVTNKGNLTIANMAYTAVVYAGGLFGYALENGSYPGIDGAYQYGKVSINASRPARTVWKDELTSGATMATGNIGGFLGGLLNDAIVYEGASMDINISSMTSFTAKGASSADVGNLQYGEIAWGMKDYPTNCTNYADFTLTGTVGGTFYSGMFGAAYNYSRKNCTNYGTQTINATIKTNCFPSHGCYDGAANATFVNCHNHGDIVFGPKCKITRQLRTGMIYAKIETADKTNVIDGCSNSGDIIVEKGATIGTECRLGSAVGCQVRGRVLIRNGFTNTGNISFAGAHSGSNSSVNPLCLGGIIGNSANNGEGDSNASLYALAAKVTIGAIAYEAGSWTGDVVNTGDITYTGTSKNGVTIGGLFASAKSPHSTYPYPTGMRFVYTGDISASGTFVKATTATDTTASVELINGIGGIYGYSNIANLVVENAEVYTNITASGYPNVGMLFGFARTANAYAKNCKVGGSTAREYNTEDEEYITNYLTASNYYKYIYASGASTDWSGTDNYDGCTWLSSKPAN